MKIKKGICVDCPPGSGERPLTAGRCSMHYWKYRAIVNNKKPAAIVKKDHKDELTKWYEMQLTMRPKCCENCGVSLYDSMIINPRTVVCHIVSKSLFPEVSTHPLNRWFGCKKCHTLYDTNPSEINHMSVFRIVMKRFNEFRRQVLSNNFYKIPEPLK